MPHGDLSRFTYGAQLERRLRTLKPGEAMDVSRHEWHLVEVPANPLDRQTPAYLAEWFRIRMPFHCVTREDILTGKWTFERPRADSRS